MSDLARKVGSSSLAKSTRDASGFTNRSLPSMTVIKEYKMLEAIQVKDAYKKFGKTSHPLWKGRENHSVTGKVVKVAVDHVSFSVHEAEIFGVLGPNGSGKSTLIRLISTVLLPDEGSVTVFGHDVVVQPMEGQRLINRESGEP